MNEQATDDGLFLKVENDTIEWTLNLHLVLVVQIFIDVELKNPKGTEMLNKQNEARTCPVCKVLMSICLMNKISFMISKECFLYMSPIFSTNGKLNF